MKGLKRVVFNSGFLLKNKKLILRLGANYLKLMTGRKVLRTLILSIEDRCQLRCKHCSIALLQSSHKERMDINLMKKTIKQAKELGAISVTLTGGEPLLNKNIYDILNYIKKCGLISNINTNGLLLDKRTCERLKINGLGNITFSLDYLDGKKHDKFRNKKGVFKKAIKGIYNAQEHGIPFLVSCVVSHETIANGETESFLKFAKKNRWDVTISPAAKVGRWEKNENLLLDWKDQRVLRNILNKPGVRTDKEANYLKKGCSAGTENIYVSSYGDVMPCDFIQVSFGNIRDQSLSEIYKKMHKLSYFRNINKKCLPAENRRFIEQFLDPIIGKPKPVNIDDHPNKFLQNLPAHYNSDPYSFDKNKYLCEIMEYGFNQIFDKKYGKILEIGAGCGFYLQILANYGKEITCIDENPHMVKLAKKFIRKKNLKNINSHIGDAMSLKFDDNTFDCVVGYDILHHVHDHKKAIKEAYRVLKKGGIYIGVEPNVFNPLIFFLQLKDRIEWGAFKCNRNHIGNLFNKQFSFVKIGSNNIVQSRANKATFPIVNLVDKICSTPLFKTFSFNYTIFAKK